MGKTGGSEDWEGLAATSLTTDVIYIAQEYSPMMFEWSVSTNSFTGKSWSFPGMKATSKAGLEGFTFIASKNVWLAGSQSDATVSEYTCDLSTSGECIKTGTVWKFGLGEISGLGYDFSDDTVYALSDDDDKFVQFDTSGNELRRRAVSISHPEGIMPMGNGQFVLADDGGALVMCDLGADLDAFTV